MGSLVATTTGGGLAGVQYRYGPYGKTERAAGVEGASTSSELGYTGGVRLSEDIVHLNARFYVPAVRRCASVRAPMSAGNAVAMRTRGARSAQAYSIPAPIPRSARSNRATWCCK